MIRTAIMILYMVLFIALLVYVTWTSCASYRGASHTTKTYPMKGTSNVK